MDPRTPRPGVSRTSPPRSSPAASLLQLVALFALSGLLLALPSVGWAAEGEGLPGPTWAWVGATVLQAIVTVAGGVAVALAREALRSQRASVDRLAAQLDDTRQNYVTHQQLNQRLDDVINPLRKDIDDLEAEVKKLNSTMDRVAAQNEQILALLDPRGTRR